MLLVEAGFSCPFDQFKICWPFFTEGGQRYDDLRIFNIKLRMKVGQRIYQSKFSRSSGLIFLAGQLIGVICPLYDLTGL